MEFKELTTNFLGRNVIYYKEIDSTQLEILRKINNLTNGAIIMADIQTNGKGTHGRVWHTSEKNNIAFSFVIYPNCNVRKLEGITKEIAETLVLAIKNIYNIELNIKHPNDIVYNNRKIGGILTQDKLNGEIVKYIVIGIGINTVQTEFPKEIENYYIHDMPLLKREVDRIKIITEFCNLFEQKLLERSHI